MLYNGIFSCRNKVAVVTGGTGLIGKEVVKGLCENDAIVYVADINEENAGEIMQGKKRFIYFDVTSEDSVREGISSIVQESQRIDILVNMAYPRSQDWGLKFEQIPYSSWIENVNNQLGGYFLTCQSVAEQMRLQGKGSIINLASIYGVVGPDFSIYHGTQMTMPAAYSAIKGGIIAFTKYLATYYGKYNIRVNSISPGGIFDNQDATFIKNYSMKTPLGRMGLPNEIVGAVIFLASDASSYVTGHNLVVDGGWTAW